MKWIFVLVCMYGMASANVPENRHMRSAGLFQGDIVLTPEQKSAIESGGDPTRVGRAAFRGNLWPNGVMPYTIDYNLRNNRGAMASIRAGMKLWTDSTCITFKERTNERNYVRFFIGGGCYSMVGVAGGKQDLSLASGCWYQGTTSHEIAHALGFYHEQSRPDRDQYVQIIWNNIPSGVRYNFNKMTTSQIDTLGTPYDYASVMHYDRTAFGSGRETIRALKAGVTLGNKRGPTAIDIKQMNLLYKCSGGGGGGGGGGTTAPVTQPPVTQPPSGCTDNHGRCSYWASTGECQKNPGYMLVNCKKSCKVAGCGGGACVDKDTRCRYWGSYCNNNNYVIANCKKTCRRC